MEKDREKTDLKVEIIRVQKQLEADFTCAITNTNDIDCGDGNKHLDVR